MRKASKISIAEHNDNFGLITCGIMIGMAMMAIAHLFATVIL